MAAKVEEEDQILAQLGHIGSWQWRVILVTGLFSTPTVCHTMVITFMNAEVRALYSRRQQKPSPIFLFRDISLKPSFDTVVGRKVGKWCRRPRHLQNMSVAVWRNISGQGEEGCEVSCDWWREPQYSPLIGAGAGPGLGRGDARHGAAAGARGRHAAVRQLGVGHGHLPGHHHQVSCDWWT